MKKRTPRRVVRRHSHTHDIVHALRAVLAQGRKILMATKELKDALAKIDTATDNIAADIQRLKDKIGTGMTTAEVADVQAEADRIASKLEGIAADPDNPDPTA